LLGRRQRHVERPHLIAAVVVAVRVADVDPAAAEVDEALAAAAIDGWRLLAVAAGHMREALEIDGHHGVSPCQNGRPTFTGPTWNLVLPLPLVLPMLTS